MIAQSNDVIFKCPHCGVPYQVTYSRAPTKDSGTAYCKNCRKKMSEWNDYDQPTYIALSEKLRNE